MIRSKLKKIIENPYNISIKELGESDVLLGNTYADNINTLLSKKNISHKKIHAIGNHGQTIFHSTSTATPFSYQIGNASNIATKTGIPCISDFRNMDIALGGQGAPLVPAFHQSIFSSQSEKRIILNLGGIANVTVLDKDVITGYDTGPANTLSDIWVYKVLGKNFDQDGLWARSGILNEKLLSYFLSDPYFTTLPPKSTGREHFNLNWIISNIQKLPLNIEPENIQRTLVELTAKSIALSIENYNTESIYICGGGVKNKFLLERIHFYLPKINFQTTDQLGIDPQFVEASCFAWLARQYTLKKPGNIPSATGARSTGILGCEYLPPSQVH
jgi:anhydro-N-acetylmuramic acid kinase